MRLTKTHSLFLALAIIGVFFALAFLTVKRGTRPAARLVSSDRLPVPAPRHPANGEPATGSNPDFVLSQFQRSEIREGRKVWEVKADKGYYTPETATATLENARLWLFDKEDNVIELRARGAVLHLEAASLSKAEVFDGVKLIRNNEVFVDTERAVYDKTNEKLSAPGFVQMRSANLDVSGQSLVVDLQNKELTLSADVSSIVRPKGQEIALGSSQQEEHEKN